MKRIYIQLLVLVFGFQLNAQEITSGEYFWNSDPGFGNATGFTVGPGDEIMENLDIQINGLSEGIHRLGIRLLDDNGHWSLCRYSFHMIVDNAIYPIVAMEYFWDNDPGYGNGRSVNLSSTESFATIFQTESTGLPTGNHTICYRIKGENGRWSLNSCQVITICTNYEPVAGFNFHRDNRTVYASDTSQHADSVFYVITDELANIISVEQEVNLAYTFDKAGNYTITQVVLNDCGIDSSEVSFVLRGIDGIFPDITTTNALYLSEIYGGFADIQEVSMVFNGNEIYADTFIKVTEEYLEAKFFLDSLQSEGQYDLIIHYDNSSDTLKQSIQVESLAEFIPVSNIIGQQQFLINTWKPYQITLKNVGNTIEYAVPFYIEMPGRVSGRITSEIGTAGPIPPIILAKYDVDKFMLSKDSITNDSTTFILLTIPIMRPNELITIDIEIRTSVIEDFTIETAFGDGYIEGYEIQNYDNLRTSCSFINDCLQPLLDFMSIVPGVGCVIGAASLGCSIGNLANGAGSGAGFGGWASGVQNLGMDVISVASCGTGPNPFSISDDFDAVIGVILGLGSAANSLAGIGPGGGAGSPGGGPGAGGSPGGCGCSAGCDGNVTIFKPAGALDPNEKYGPLGPTDARYINASSEEMTYQIAFENVDSATAPARVVRLIDTLDINYFHLDSIQFTKVRFGDSIYMFNQVYNQFIQDFDLRPAKNTILRIEGNIDLANGTLTIDYKSLDPTTMDLTQIVSDGFLNPNVNGSEGQGYIEFIVPNKELNHLDRIENTALIFFDGNDPIVTNTWHNTVDEERPNSDVINVTTYNREDSLYYIHLNLEDEHSGIKSYHVWYAKEGEEYTLLAQYAKSDSVIAKLHPNENYIFISEAIDQVFNYEELPNEPLLNPDYSYSTVVSNSNNQLVERERVAIYPNPATNHIVFKLEDYESVIRKVVLYGLTGKKIKTWEGIESNQPLNLVNLSKGVYILEIQFGESIISKKLILE